MGPINTVQIQIQYLKIIYFQFFFNFVLMGKSDQHKKLVETCGEKTVDFLKGPDPEGGYAKTSHTNSPYTMQASRVSIHLGVYRVKKKKLFINFSRHIGQFKDIFVFLKKKYFFGLARP